MTLTTFPITIVALLLLFIFPLNCRKYTEEDMHNIRHNIKEMFYHAYNNYLNLAYPYDELRPLSCDGVNTWGSFSLTLIDALDTLLVMGNHTEFRRVGQIILDKIDFNADVNVSVFETNIRVVGGLLSAHFFSAKAGMNVSENWPCEGPFLSLAEKVARKLLPAFNTNTGMPYGTVNLALDGVPYGETTVTCTAGITTFIVEFGTLSRLTGDPVFEQAAMKALSSMWNAKSDLNLVGNHIDVLSSKWTATDSGIGAGVDSYFEYLVKGAILFQKPDLMAMFEIYKEAIDKHLRQDDWYMWVNMHKGGVTIPVFQSLEAFWPGLLSLVGDNESALKSIYTYSQIWKQYGFHPEFYSISQSTATAGRESYPLRPEFVESLMYLYRATKDPTLLAIGADVVESINFSSRTNCGYATVNNVFDHTLENRMESFFLAETTKYLYLLFDPDNFLHGDGGSGHIVETKDHGSCLLSDIYVFNTEAHPIDISAVRCCERTKEEREWRPNMDEDLDLLALLDLDQASLLSSPANSRRKKAQKLSVLNNQPNGKLKFNSLTDRMAYPEFTALSSINFDVPNTAEATSPGKLSDVFYNLINSVLKSKKVVQLHDIPIPGPLDKEARKEANSAVLQNTTIKYKEASSAEGGANVSQIKTVAIDLDVLKQKEGRAEELDKSSSSYNALLSYMKNAKGLMTCPAQPYAQMLSVHGEMFNVRRT